MPAFDGWRIQSYLNNVVDFITIHICNFLQLSFICSRSIVDSVHELLLFIYPHFNDFRSSDPNDDLGLESSPIGPRGSRAFPELIYDLHVLLKSKVLFVSYLFMQYHLSPF